AHECAVHEMPKTFGKVGWVIFDENPLDAFIFGIDINDRVTLGLDTLQTPPAVNQPKPGSYFFKKLSHARKILYRALNKLLVPIDFFQGAAVPLENLKPFIATPEAAPSSNRYQGAEYDPQEMRALTFQGKVDPHIRPDTPKEQLETKLQEAEN